MNVNVLQTNNPYLSKLEQINRSKAVKENNHTKKDATINNNEMKYFQKLFPANASQIENYVSFNRQGNITNINTNKGSIIDSKM
jgi:hypothetical protein